MTASPHVLLDFWLNTVGPDHWYDQDAAFDDRIRADYGALWERGLAGELDPWRADPRTCLALVILLDQFPRNMFRGDARSFASDAKALAITKSALVRGHERGIGLPDRVMLFMPLMHSEALPDQDRAVRLILRDFGRDSGWLHHAQAHRLVIRRFGRFPYRNAALGRRDTPTEAAFVKAGGYSAAFAETGAAAA